MVNMASKAEMHSLRRQHRQAWAIPSFSSWFTQPLTRERRSARSATFFPGFDLPTSGHPSTRLYLDLS